MTNLLDQVRPSWALTHPEIYDQEVLPTQALQRQVREHPERFEPGDLIPSHLYHGSPPLTPAEVVAIGPAPGESRAAWSDRYWGREDWHRQYGRSAVRCTHLCDYGSGEYAVCRTAVPLDLRDAGLCRRHANMAAERAEPGGEYTKTARLAEECETIRRGARRRGKGPIEAYMRLMAAVFGERDQRPVDDATYAGRHAEALLFVEFRRVG